MMYSKAIELDGGNPVFYCNRAAAHSKMNNHHLAIEDCQRAIDMDPSYSKAYGRMGLAHRCVFSSFCVFDETFFLFQFP